ncbi:MAG: hypothetical protein LZF62_240042 [Nitrospira sp.]|nr:MAG: hypothetical protein LZF62_240042 [Nitrospira sp.]
MNANGASAMSATYLDSLLRSATSNTDPLSTGSIESNDATDVRVHYKSFGAGSLLVKHLDGREAVSSHSDPMA